MLFVILLQSYYHIPIVQWGYGYDGDTIRFPISFPKKVFACLVTPNSGGQGTPHSEQLTNSGFHLLSGTGNNAYYFVLGN